MGGGWSRPPTAASVGSSATCSIVWVVAAGMTRQGRGGIRGKEGGGTTGEKRTRTVVVGQRRVPRRVGSGQRSGRRRHSGDKLRPGERGKVGTNGVSHAVGAGWTRATHGAGASTPLAGARRARLDGTTSAVLGLAVRASEEVGCGCWQSSVHMFPRDVCRVAHRRAREMQSFGTRTLH